MYRAIYRSLAGALLATAPSGMGGEAHPTPAHEPPGAQEFAIWPDGLPLIVPGEVGADGRKARFLIDTGSSRNAFNLARHREALVAGGEESVMTPTGIQKLKTYKGIPASFGKQTIPETERYWGQDFSLMEVYFGSRLDVHLGTPAFAGLTLDIDCRTGTLKIHQGSVEPDFEAVDFDFTMVKGVPYFKADFGDGISANLVIDTGSIGTEFDLEPEVFEQLVEKGLVALGPNKRSASANRITEHRHGRAEALSLGGLVVRDAGVAELARNRMGLAALARFRVVIDFEKNLLRLAPRGDGFGRPVDSFEALGMAIAFTKPLPTIMNVREGRDAGAAGVARGDKLVRIAGFEGGQLDAGRLYELVTENLGKRVEILTKGKGGTLDSVVEVKPLK